MGRYVITEMEEYTNEKGIITALCVLMIAALIFTGCTA